jgi:hypothetical protein
VPFFQLMLGRINREFDWPGVNDIPAEMFDPGASLVDLALENEIAITPREAAVLRAIPRGMQEALRAIIRDNLSREVSLAMTFAWAPGYDYELQFWEAPGDDGSKGGITVLLRTRYPSDTHPTEPEALDSPV